MKIMSVTDPAFKNYGQIITGYDLTELIATLDRVSPCPEGTVYVAEDPELQKLPIVNQLRNNLFGGMPIEMGYCSGHNTKLNGLEYHRDSEINLGVEDFILLLAKREEIGDDGILDTDKVVAFKCPAGVMIEVYATTLHYAPCNAKAGQGFKTLVILPQGTNTAKPEIAILNDEDKALRACNKWLLAHPDTDAVKTGGAFAGLRGVNIDIAADI